MKKNADNYNFTEYARIFGQYVKVKSKLCVRSLKSVSGGEGNICVAALTRRNLSALDENELFMELIRDVANELDINVLCHKILVNVELLTHADRGSLFLARGPREARYLVAKLFDVTVDTGNKKIQFHILRRVFPSATQVRIQNIETGHRAFFFRA